MKRNLITTAVFFLILFPGCMENQKYSGKTIEVSTDIINANVGDNFTIQLESNPTTGYSWRIAGVLPDMLELISADLVTVGSSSNTVGTSGIEYWNFRVIKKGMTKLNLEYVRPWESNQLPVNQKTYTVIAE